MAKSKPRFGRGSGKRHPVDVHVGGRVKQRRVLLGLTQTDLSDALGLTFQQVQKYERGANRISASRLCELSRVLDVPIEYFFEDMPPEIAATRLRSKPFLRRRPESPQDYVALGVLRRPADADMGIDLRDRRLSDVDRRSAFAVVVHWARELIRALNNRTDARHVCTGARPVDTVTG